VPGVRGVYDRLNSLGQVIERLEGTVIDIPGSRWRAFYLETDNPDGPARHAVRLPERRSDCTLDGPTLTNSSWTHWRFTILDESAAEPSKARKPRKRFPPLDWPAINAAVSPELVKEGAKPPNPSWRFYGERGEPMFCWTTERGPRDFLSFVLVPTGPGARSGQATRYRVDPASVSRAKVRNDATARAQWLHEQWQRKGGTPWR
jgi:hypothetical protein